MSTPVSVIANKPDPSQPIPTEPWMYSQTLGYITDPEALAAFEEAEEMIRKIKAGDRAGCMTIEEYHAEMHKWDEEDYDGEV